MTNGLWEDLNFPGINRKIELFSRGLIDCGSSGELPQHVPCLSFLGIIPNKFEYRITFIRILARFYIEYKLSK